MKLRILSALLTFVMVLGIAPAYAQTERFLHHIPWRFITYSEPDFKAQKLDGYNAQTVVVLEKNENGWALISTANGAQWVYIDSPMETTITISAAGDFTLGYDYRLGYGNSFMHEFDRQGGDYTYFLRNVKDIFEASDISIANVEGALTNGEEHEDKQFVFRGPPEFAKIMSSSGINAATIANNHTRDYMYRGYTDTVKALDDEGIAVFGNEFTAIKTVDDIKVGMFGFSVWDDFAYNRNRVSAAIKKLKDAGAELLIAYYHWGVESTHYPVDYQRRMGQFSIDEGVHLVLGSHPHVIQGVEEYKNRNIVYSMGNFCYGGHRNPPDKDAFIFQQTFTFRAGELVPDNNKNIIPVKITSDRARNNFQPTVAEGADAEKIFERLATYSADF